MKNARAMRTVRSIGLFSMIFAGGVFRLFAAAVATAPDEAAFEKGAVQFFLERSETEPKLRISGASAVQVPTTTGSSTVFSRSNTDIELTRVMELAGLRFGVRPKKLRYSVFVAQVRKFDVEFASGSATNKFSTTDSGLSYGLGVSGSFVPSSVASVGVGWDVQVRQTRVDFERFVSEAGTVAAGQVFIEDEVQAAVTACKRFGPVTPYAGLKVSRWISKLKDRSTGEILRGNTNGASVLAGFQFEPVPGEVGFIEASIVDDESISAGWGFRF